MLLFIGMLTLAFNIQSTRAEPATITVPDDYPTIQEAINAANPGDIIFVKNGTYYENIVVNKTVSLIGESRENAIIDGNGTGIVISIRANYTKLVSFSITNGQSGIWMIGRSILNNTVTYCKIMNNSAGIRLWGASNCTLTRNNVINNRIRGVELFLGSNNTVSGNVISSNNEVGVYLRSSYNNKLYRNNFINNSVQVYVEESSNVWDDGYPSGGNYWSDYIGVDVKRGLGQDLPGSDGIGDMPYIIDANNADRYPLMNPYGAPPPPTYDLTITTTVGGTTDPAPGTYSYTANSTVQVTAFPEAGYLFDHWELDDVNVGSANPYTVLMDKDHTLKAVFSPIPPPLSVSISPLSASILVGQSVTFTSTVSGGIPPYSYQWYLNGSAVPGATADSWTFTPVSVGVYEVYLNVTDSSGNIAISQIATVSVASQITVSISPMSMAVIVGEPVTFTSTTSGGYPPYTYQWYLNGNPVSGATSDTWTFTPTESGIFYVYLKVTDDKGNTAQSETARITVSAVPVGGYSIPIQLPTTAKPVNAYFALLTILTAILITIKRKTKKKAKM